MGKILLLFSVLSLSFYLVITTVIDCILMGMLHFHVSLRPWRHTFLIKTPNQIHMQTGFRCSAFSSAYVLRHWGREAEGDALYEHMPNKMKDGYVYPRGIQKLLPQYGLKVRYCAGNLNALKNAVSMGSPVVVMIRVRPDKNWLHYVPVVGYDEEYIYVAESLPELVNCDEGVYNRKIPTVEFQKLWNTAMMKMPLYGNTYFTVQEGTK